MTRYWKFLVAGHRSPFAGFDWAGAGGDWVDAQAAVACRAGIHACRAADLPYWLADELWEVELVDPVELPAKVVASRGRLRARVEGWTPETRRELALACAARTALHARDELLDAGVEPGEAGRRPVDAGGAAGAFDVAEVRAAGEALVVAAEQAGPAGNQGRRLAQYVLDAADYLDECPVATIAYIAARAANSRSTAQVADPYAEERSWQAAWLVGRLDLTP